MADDQMMVDGQPGDGKMADGNVPARTTSTGRISKRSSKFDDFVDGAYRKRRVNSPSTIELSGSPEAPAGKRKKIGDDVVISISEKTDQAECYTTPGTSAKKQKEREVNASSTEWRNIKKKDVSAKINAAKTKMVKKKPIASVKPLKKLKVVQSKVVGKKKVYVNLKTGTKVNPKSHPLENLGGKRKLLAKATGQKKTGAKLKLGGGKFPCATNKDRKISTGKASKGLSTGKKVGSVTSGKGPKELSEAELAARRERRVESLKKARAAKALKRATAENEKKNSPLDTEDVSLSNNSAELPSESSSSSDKILNIFESFVQSRNWSPLPSAEKGESTGSVLKGTEDFGSAYLSALKKILQAGMANLEGTKNDASVAQAGQTDADNVASKTVSPAQCNKKPKGIGKRKRTLQKSTTSVAAADTDETSVPLPKTPAAVSMDSPSTSISSTPSVANRLPKKKAFPPIDASPSVDESSSPSQNLPDVASVTEASTTPVPRSWDDVLTNVLIDEPKYVKKRCIHKPMENPSDSHELNNVAAPSRAGKRTIKRNVRLSGYYDTTMIDCDLRKSCERIGGKTVEKSEVGARSATLVSVSDKPAEQSVENKVGSDKAETVSDNESMIAKFKNFRSILDSVMQQLVTKNESSSGLSSKSRVDENKTSDTLSENRVSVDETDGSMQSVSEPTHLSMPSSTKNEKWNSEKCDDGSSTVNENDSALDSPDICVELNATKESSVDANFSEKNECVDEVPTNMTVPEMQSVVDTVLEKMSEGSEVEDKKNNSDEGMVAKFKNFSSILGSVMKSMVDKGSSGNDVKTRLESSSEKPDSVSWTIDSSNTNCLDDASSTPSAETEMRSILDSILAKIPDGSPTKSPLSSPVTKRKNSGPSPSPNAKATKPKPEKKFVFQKCPECKFRCKSFIGLKGHMIWAHDIGMGTKDYPLMFHDEELQTGIETISSDETAEVDAIPEVVLEVVDHDSKHENESLEVAHSILDELLESIVGVDAPPLKTIMKTSTVKHVSASTSKQDENRNEVVKIPVQFDAHGQKGTSFTTIIHGRSVRVVNSFYHCPDCQFRNDNYELTFQHMLKKHELQMYTSPFTFHCTSCNLFFKKLGGYIHHKRNCDKELLCPDVLCLKVFSEAEFPKHLMKHSKNVNMLQHCEFCGLKLDDTNRSKKFVNCHQMCMTHSLLKCYLCGLLTSSVAELKEHIAAHRKPNILKNSGSSKMMNAANPVAIQWPHVDVAGKLRLLVPVPPVNESRSSASMDAPLDLSKPTPVAPVEQEDEEEVSSSTNVSDTLGAEVPGGENSSIVEPKIGPIGVISSVYTLAKEVVVSLGAHPNAASNAVQSVRPVSAIEPSDQSTKGIVDLSVSSASASLALAEKCSIVLDLSTNKNTTNVQNSSTSVPEKNRTEPVCKPANSNQILNSTGIVNVGATASKRTNTMTSVLLKSHPTSSSKAAVNSVPCSKQSLLGYQVNYANPTPNSFNSRRASRQQFQKSQSMVPAANQVSTVRSNATSFTLPASTSATDPQQKSVGKMGDFIMKDGVLYKPVGRYTVVKKDSELGEREKSIGRWTARNQAIANLQSVVTTSSEKAVQKNTTNTLFFPTTKPVDVPKIATSLLYTDLEHLKDLPLKGASCLAPSKTSSVLLDENNEPEQRQKPVFEIRLTAKNSSAGDGKVITAHDVIKSLSQTGLVQRDDVAASTGSDLMDGTGHEFCREIANKDDLILDFEVISETGVSKGTAVNNDAMSQERLVDYDSKVNQVMAKSENTAVSDGLKNRFDLVFENGLIKMKENVVETPKSELRESIEAAKADPKPSTSVEKQIISHMEPIRPLADNSCKASGKEMNSTSGVLEDGSMQPIDAVKAGPSVEVIEISEESSATPPKLEEANSDTPSADPPKLSEVNREISSRRMSEDALTIMSDTSIESGIADMSDNKNVADDLASVTSECSSIVELATPEKTPDLAIVETEIMKKPKSVECKFANFLRRAKSTLKPVPNLSKRSGIKQEPTDESFKVDGYVGQFIKLEPQEEDGNNAQNVKHETKSVVVKQEKLSPPKRSEPSSSSWDTATFASSDAESDVSCGRGTPDMPALAAADRVTPDMPILSPAGSPRKPTRGASRSVHASPGKSLVKTLESAKTAETILQDLDNDADTIPVEHPTRADTDRLSDSSEIQIIAVKKHGEGNADELQLTESPPETGNGVDVTVITNAEKPDETISAEGTARGSELTDTNDEIGSTETTVTEPNESILRNRLLKGKEVGEVSVDCITVPVADSVSVQVETQADVSVPAKIVPVPTNNVSASTNHVGEPDENEHSCCILLPEGQVVRIRSEIPIQIDSGNEVAAVTKTLLSTPALQSGLQQGLMNKLAEKEDENAKSIIFTERDFSTLLCNISDAGTVVCRLCSKLYADSRAMRLHARHAHGITVGGHCAFCHQAFTPLKLKEHYHHEHGTLIPPKKSSCVCKRCGKEFTEKYQLMSHLSRSHQKHYCQHCGGAFETREKLIAHMESHLTVGGATCKANYCDCSCRICAFKFPNCGARFEHERRRHYYKCKLCEYLFKNAADVRDHELKHRTFLCNLCPLRFGNKSSLEQHCRSAHRDDCNVVKRRRRRKFKWPGNAGTSSNVIVVEDAETPTLSTSAALPKSPAKRFRRLQRGRRDRKPYHNRNEVFDRSNVRDLLAQPQEEDDYMPWEMNASVPPLHFELERASDALSPLRPTLQRSISAATASGSIVSPPLPRRALDHWSRRSLERTSPSELLRRTVSADGEFLPSGVLAESSTSRTERRESSSPNPEESQAELNEDPNDEYPEPQALTRKTILLQLGYSGKANKPRTKASLIKSIQQNAELRALYLSPVRSKGRPSHCLQTQPKLVATPPKVPKSSTPGSGAGGSEREHCSDSNEDSLPDLGRPSEEERAALLANSSQRSSPLKNTSQQSTSSRDLDEKLAQRIALGLRPRQKTRRMDDGELDASGIDFRHFDSNFPKKAQTQPTNKSWETELPGEILVRRKSKSPVRKDPVPLRNEPVLPPPSRVCRTCGIRFATQAEHSSHQQICVVCCSEIPLCRDMEFHMKSSHFQCPHCSEWFSMRYYVNFHSCQGSGEFKCDICDANHANMTELTEHVREHFCSLCGKYFKEIDMKNTHMRSHLIAGNENSGETNDETLVLDDDIPSDTKDDVSGSMICKCCSKSCDDADALTAHLRNNHFQCDICGDFFVDEDAMIDHMDDHFSCKFCTKSFVTRDECDDHVANMHGGIC